MSVVPICKEYRKLQPADVVPLFLMFKKASGLSPRTLLDYRKTLDLSAVSGRSRFSTRENPGIFGSLRKPELV